MTVNPTLNINRLSEKGEGIAEFSGREIYVRGAVPGDVVTLNVGEPFARGSKRCPGKIISFAEKSPLRGSFLCPHSQDCGSCTLGLLSAKAQIDIKRQDISEALASIGALYQNEIEIFSLEELPCRFKSIRYFADVDGKVVNGFYESRSHKVVPVDNCILEPSWFSAFAKELCLLADRYALNSYNGKSGTLRSLMLRDSGSGDSSEKLALLGVASRPVDDFLEALKKLALSYGIKALFLDENVSCGNKVVAGNLLSLGTDSTIQVELGALRYQVSAQSFMQVNYSVAQALYKEAVDWCKGSRGRQALDICCGVGTMTLMLSRYFNRVTGIEIVEQAVAAARENAAQNGIKNCEFVAGDMSECIGRYLYDEVDAVIADPSRAGLGPKVCRALSRLKGEVRLCCIFCSLIGLKRDIPMLLEGGYRIHKVKGFDMFKNSRHIETMVLLSK